MNRINPKKLLHSKWTAVQPENKEKHFMITETEFDEDGLVVLCSIEAVLTKQSTQLDWHDLKDEKKWIHGWQ